MDNVSNKLTVGFIQLAALLIIIAGIKTAQDLIVPFLLSIFTATIAATPMFWLNKKGAPSWLSIFLVMFGIILSIIFVGGLVAQSTSSFAEKLPFYQSQLLALQQELEGAVNPLINYLNLELDFASILGNFSPTTILNLASSTITGLGSVLSNSFLIILTVIFILAEATSFPKKLNMVLANPEKSLLYFSEFTKNLNNYIAIKTTLSAATGLIVATFLSSIGVDFPILWGLLAFLLNFVPNIGSIIAAVPPVILAYVQLGSVTASLVIIGFIIINIFIGSFIEPKYLGKGLGLSPLVVFLSLVFWGWVLGPVGMLLSVPLTMTAKLALEANPDTKGIAIFLGASERAEEEDINTSD